VRKLGSKYKLKVRSAPYWRIGQCAISDEAANFGCLEWSADAAAWPVHSVRGRYVSHDVRPYANADSMH